MSWLETISTGFLLGLAGSLHCVGMCGAIVTSLSFSTQRQSFSRATLTTLFYNSGRIITYVVLGALVGVIGAMGDNLGFLSILRIIAALLLVMTGLYLTNWWKGLLLLERAGQTLWAKLKPLTSKLSPSSSPVHAVASGILWGFIPCGLVYSALGIATAQGGITQSMAFMLTFGAGTFAPMMMMGIGFTRVAQWFRQPWLRYLLAFGLIAFGSFTLFTAIAHMGHITHIEQIEQQQDNHKEHHYH